MAYVRVKVYRYGKTAANMKGIGKVIEQMGKADLSTRMVIATMENGWMTKLMVEVLMNIKIEPSMSGTGKKINNMDMVLKHGLTELVMKETMSLERNMASELSNGVTVPIM